MLKKVLLGGGGRKKQAAVGYAETPKGHGQMGGESVELVRKLNCSNVLSAKKNGSVAETKHNRELIVENEGG